MKVVVQYILYLLLFPIAKVMQGLGVRFILLSMPNVIGHLAAELDCAIRTWRSKRRPTRMLILLISRSFRPNVGVISHAQRHIIVAEGRFTRFLLRPYLNYEFLRLDLRKLILPQSASPYFSFTAAQVGSRPAFHLTEEDHARGRAVLREMGVPEDRWIVALHFRESGYHPTVGQEARNADIQTAALAVREIYKRGGWCIRMGDATMNQAPEWEGLTDYARSPQKSDQMDVYLCGSARMFLGSSSGLVFIASLFGVPVACTNVVPFGTSLMAVAGAVCLPKRVADKSGRVLSFAETAQHPSAFDNLCESYQPAGLDVIDNTPEEIQDVAIEVLERIDGTYSESAEDIARQNAYKQLVTPDHYCFGSGARIGRDFLRRHKAYL